MNRKLIIFSICILSLSWTEAQYISEVLEFVPAPGQFTNTSPWGSPVAASTIAGGVNGSMCLGAFGGYVVFRFQDPVENHPQNPYGVDFTIFGNPMAHWSEPGVVWVMRDENGNGLPDDTWYELAGSDYHFSSTIRNYQVTYSNPGDTVARDVPWFDQLGNSGIIRANSVHTQPYYPLHDSFPTISEEGYTLSGTKIRGAVDVDHPPILKSGRRIFGYADNHLRGQAPYIIPDNPYTPEVENSGGDAFDISWAVDSDGNYVDLDQVHFVKVQNALQADGSYLGELSTEITGAVDVVEDPSLTGNPDLIVIRDLPLEIVTPEYQLEVFIFYQGRLQSGQMVQWTTSHKNAIVNENHVLRVNKSGLLTLTASLTAQPEIKASVSTTIQLGQTTGETGIEANSLVQLYPNPANDFFYVSGMEGASITLYDTSGKLLMSEERYQANSGYDIGGLAKGVYIIKLRHKGVTHILKLLKE